MDAIQRRNRGFAAKWRADGHTEEPTDDALREAFKTCAKPIRAEFYPQVREEIAAWALADAPLPDGQIELDLFA